MKQSRFLLRLSISPVVLLLTFEAGIASGQQTSMSAGQLVAISNSCLSLRNYTGWKLRTVSSSGSWKSLGSPESGSVSECSIAGNDKSLYVIYDAWHPELNFNLGNVKNWSGSAWEGSGQINDCNGPVIAIKDSVIVEGWLSKNYEYNFSTNENGNWWGVESASLYHQYGVHVAIAERDKGYIEYSSGIGDLGVCVGCPPAGYGCIMNGHGSNIGSVINAQFTGDDSGWVTLYAVNGWLYAYGTTGPCNDRPFNDRSFRDFYSSGGVQPQQVVSRAGITTAIWTDADTLYVAEWRDTCWVMVASGPAAGKYYGISATTVDSILYVSYGDTGWNPRLAVFKYDGRDVSYLDGQIEDDTNSTITSVSLTTYKGSPAIAFIENDTLRVKTYSAETGIARSGPVPSAWLLYQNYPNPFNPATRITYQLPANSFVTLKVYDMLGREIKTLVKERQSAGTHTASFNGSGLSSGVYLYRITADSYSQTRKLVLVK